MESHRPPPLQRNLEELRRPAPGQLRHPPLLRRQHPTASGLQVTAQLVDQPYEKGIGISDAQMQALDFDPHPVQPKRNYTIYPIYPRV